MRYSMRSMMIYENIMQQNFNPKGFTQILTFFYCCVLASCKDINLTIDEFIVWIDENHEDIVEFNEWLASTVNKNSYIRKKAEDGGDDSKNA